MPEHIYNPVLVLCYGSFSQFTIADCRVFFTSTSLGHLFTVGPIVFPYSGKIYLQIVATLTLFLIVFFAMDFFLGSVWLFNCSGTSILATKLATRLVGDFHFVRVSVG